VIDIPRPPACGGKMPLNSCHSAGAERLHKLKQKRPAQAGRFCFSITVMPIHWLAEA